MDEDDKKLFAAYSSNKQTPKKLEEYLERALAYFVFRHVSPAEDDADFRNSLGLALFFERLLCSAISTTEDLDDTYVFDVARKLSEEFEYSEENTDVLKFEFMI